jgi:predicted ATPase
VIRGGQLFAHTHSPDLLNAARPDEVFWMEQRNGTTTIRRASDNPQIVAPLAEGDTSGALWKPGLFGGANPR